MLIEPEGTQCPKVSVNIRMYISRQSISACVTFITEALHLR